MHIKKITNSPLLLSFTITVCFIIIIYVIKTAQETFLEYKNTERLRDINVDRLGYQETLPQFNKAFSIIEDLFVKVQYFLGKLKNKYPNDERINRLVSRMHGVDIQESPNDKDVSSFTIDKGEMISLCIRHKEDLNKFHNDNTLWFVICHELAHVMSVSEGHNQEFVDNFKFLLKESADMYIYNPVDYSKKNINYCGVKVTNNPYFN
jgi:hypothetical protein